MPDNDCLSFEQAKLLHLHGVRCCSKWSWITSKSDKGEGIKCLLETKDIKNCVECYPALTVEEAILILKKCNCHAVWKKEKDGFITIDMSGLFTTSLRIGKEEQNKDREFDGLDTAVRAIIHLLENGIIDAEFVNCILRKHTGYCYKHSGDKDCDDHGHDCKEHDHDRHDHHSECKEYGEKILHGLDELRKDEHAEKEVHGKILHEIYESRREQEECCEQILCAVAELHKKCCEGHEHPHGFQPHHVMTFHGEMPPPHKDDCKKYDCCEEIMCELGELGKEVRRIKKEQRRQSEELVKIKTTVDHLFQLAACK